MAINRNESSNLQSIDEIFSTKLFKVRHVPKSARYEWACTLTYTLRQIIARPVEEAGWKKLQMLPKVILPPKPKGLGTSQEYTKMIKENCKKWRDSDDDVNFSMWEEVKKSNQRAGGAKKGRGQNQRKNTDAEDTLERRNAQGATT